LLARQGASEGDAMRLSRRDVQSREVGIIPGTRHTVGEFLFYTVTLTGAINLAEKLGLLYLRGNRYRS
jgi:hypothetical protein